MKIPVWTPIKTWWRKSPLWLRIVVAAVVAILLIWVAIPGGKTDLPTATVQQGEFVVDLRETGTLRAEKSITISAPPVRINLQVIGLVPEGTVVKEGDFLLQFDSTEIQQSIDDKQANLDIARANLEQSQASMASNLAGMESSVENSRASLRLAELRLDQMKFEADVKVEEGKLNLKQAQISMTQTEQQLAAQRTINSAEVRSLELKIHQAELDLQKTWQDMRRLTITAPGTGLVVYKETWKGGEMGKIKVGDTPWRGQAMLELPDLSVMMVDAKVSEVDVAKVNPGQDVEVKLDAYPDPTFHGKVADVGVLASSDQTQEEAKMFDITVRITESDPLLRPGMTASVRIFINRIPDKAWVPIEAVFSKGEKHIVYEVSGSGWKEREVTLGARNDNHVVIETGPKAGASVALVDPTQTTGQSSPKTKSKTLGMPGQGQNTTQSAAPTPQPRVGRREIHNH